MNAAAIIFVVLLFVDAALCIVKHGQPRKVFNGPLGALGLALSLFLLWQAGLFE